MRRNPGSAVLLLAALGVLACGSETEVTQSTSASSTSGAYVRPGLMPATVTSIVDGDTIRVEIHGEEYRLRYIGIDTPESGDSTDPAQCLGPEATERNRQLVEGQVVGLEKDVSDVDRFKRLLRYVWAGDQMVNAALVGEGYALVSTHPPDVRYADMFASLQAQARERGRGLWGAACGGAAAPSS